MCGAPGGPSGRPVSRLLARASAPPWPLPRALHLRPHTLLHLIELRCFAEPAVRAHAYRWVGQERESPLLLCTSAAPAVPGSLLAAVSLLSTAPPDKASAGLLSGSSSLSAPSSCGRCAGPLRSNSAPSLHRLSRRCRRLEMRSASESASLPSAATGTSSRKWSVSDLCADMQAVLLYNVVVEKRGEAQERRHAMQR